MGNNRHEGDELATMGCTYSFKGQVLNKLSTYSGVQAFQ